MFRTGEFAGVGCLDIWSSSSSLPLGNAIGVDNPEPNSSSSMPNRRGLLQFLVVGTADDGADIVDEPEEVEEDEMVDATRFPLDEA